MMSPNAERNAEIVRLLGDGLSFGAVARRLNLTRSLVAGVSFRAGTTGRGGGPRNVARDADIMARLRAGDSYRIVAASLGMSRSAIAGVSRRNGGLRRRQPTKRVNLSEAVARSWADPIRGTARRQKLTETWAARREARA